MSESVPQPQAPKDWHLQEIRQCVEALETDRHKGLDNAQAGERLARYGGNVIESRAGRTLWQMFMGQFADFMILVLLAAAAISGLVGEPQDTIAILVIIILNAVIGTVQEYRADKALAALRRMSEPEAQVIREGLAMHVPTRELVPGDVVLLEAGNLVPADLRLLVSAELQLNEAALTGESEPVEKITGALSAEAFSLGDRLNMAYKGTVVTRGRGRGVVVNTGMHTELGRIAGLLHAEETMKTPLQKRLARFGKRLSWAVLMIAGIVFLSGLLRGEPLVLMFLTGVSMAVAAIPEALPAVVTIALALGAKSMSRRHVLMRRLPAVETLGSVTIICSDKTGTLTQNLMHLEQLFAAGGLHQGLPADADAPLWRHLGQALAVSNDVKANSARESIGDPTEVALHSAALAAGFDKREIERRLPRVGEIAFESERQRMTTLHQLDGGVVAYTKGSPEKVLAHCENQLLIDGLRPLDTKALLKQAEQLAEQGYRVLAVAYRELEAFTDAMPLTTVEEELTFLGLVALMDPPRPEVPQAVQDCRSAGITPVMITGDHPATARAIATRLGIIEESGVVLSGQELAELDDEAFDQRVAETWVYARVTPEQKIRIVKALQAQGEYVAMTGDGVNDAPALKRADIGVAMGKKGTDVAREAADMVLVDDNFASIVKAVREGRRIFDNIRKFIRYTMSSNSGEIWTLFLAPFFGLPIPLTPLQILWINLVTDGLPGLALSVEQEERGIMRRPPRPPQESIFAGGMWQYMIWVGLLIAALSIGAQAWSYHSGSSHWQTIVFTVLTFSQLVNALVIRSEHDSLFSIGLFSNRPLLGAIALTIVLQLCVIYVPVLNDIFKTEPLTLLELLVCFSLPLVVLVAVELEKWLTRRGAIYPSRAIKPERTS